MLIRKIDVVLYLVCFITLGIAFVDLIHLDQIEDRTLKKCNEHWMQEFNNKCSNAVGGMGVFDMQNYTISVPIS